jgi:hypothetical protein
MPAKDVRFSIRAENKTDKAFRAVRSSLSGLNKSVIGLGAAITGAAGIGAFSVMAKNVMVTADKIHKLNLRLGASAEALSQYRHVADLSGVSFQTFVMGLQRMTRRVAEAANGTGAARGALEELGISAETLKTMAPEKQFETLADAISKIKDPADKVRLAMKLFDSEGVSLLQMMENGAEGLREMRDEADNLGLTMGQDMVEDVAAANDAMTRVGAVFEGIVANIVGNMAPTIDDLCDRFVDWYTINKDIINQNISAVFERLTTTISFLWPYAQKIGEWFYSLADGIAYAAAQVVGFIEKLNRMSSMQVLSAGWNWISDAFSGGSGGPSPAMSSGGAAALAGAGDYSMSEDEQWAAAAMSGPTVTNNFHTQISRSDAVAIAAESARQGSRQ